MKKKVLFIVDEQRMGGVSILLKDMANTFDYRKLDVTLLILHNNGNSLIDINSNVKIIYGTNFFDVIDLSIKDVIKSKKIFKIIKKIYLVFLMKTSLIGKKIIKERKKIFENDNFDIEIAFKDGFTAIFTAYGNSLVKYHWLHYEYKKCNANANYDKLFKKILPKFNKIIAVSKGVMNDFNDLYHLEDKTMVIENMIDQDKVINKASEDIDILLDNKKINIISVGRLHPQKGYDRVIEALSKLDDEVKNKINIDIYGSGDELDNLLNLKKQYGVDNINFLGRVDNPYKYLKKYDLFILPSRYEPFGLVIVEALLLHIPVLACSNSATSELIIQDKTGYIVDNSVDGIIEGLNYIAKNKELIKKYKMNLKDYKYDNDIIIKKINNLLK